MRRAAYASILKTLNHNCKTMKRRHFLKSLFACLAIAPVLCRLRQEPEKSPYAGIEFATDPNPLRFGDVEEFARADTDRLRGQIARSLARKSPWVDLINKGDA